MRREAGKLLQPHYDSEQGNNKGQLGKNEDRAQRANDVHDHRKQDKENAGPRWLADAGEEGVLDVSRAATPLQNGIKKPWLYSSCVVQRLTIQGALHGMR